MENSSPLLPPALPVTTPARAARLLSIAAILTMAGDFLLWPAAPGLSIPLFFAAASIALLLTRDRTAWNRTTVAALILHAGSAVQAGIALSFSNLLVMSLLLVVIVGESSFPNLRPGWTRWSEAILAFLTAPAAWKWVRNAVRLIKVDRTEIGRIFGIALRVVAPTLLVAGLFTLLLGWGNAIFAKWIGEAFRFIADGIPTPTPPRIVFWIFLTTFAVALLEPFRPRILNRFWIRPVPRLKSPRDLNIARWRTLSIVTALNGMFFVANTIDAFYLWTSPTLPEGVSYSQYVHQGVYSLIAAVLLSALVLVVLFQQAPDVVKWKALQILSLLWIAQNVILIASVLLRLKLYVDVYQLSELRVYVGAFLLLVTSGFALLAWYIFKSHQLSWLLFANLLATFLLFFAVQFLDVARWVAEFNVSRWQHDRTRTLDVGYLASLGPTAYPALISVAETPGRPEAHDAYVKTETFKLTEQTRLQHLNWRSIQSRKDKYTRLLVSHEIRTRNL